MDSVTILFFSLLFISLIGFGVNFFGSLRYVQQNIKERYLIQFNLSEFL